MFDFAGQRPATFPNQPPASADVVIIGGGIIGIMAAWFLTKSGQRAVVVEKGRVGAEQSTRNWGWLRQQLRDPGELPIMLEAMRHWTDLAAQMDLGFQQSGILYCAQSDKRMARFEGWLDIARGHGLDSRMLTGGQLAALVPEAATTYRGGIHTPSDARVEPWVAIPALARALAAQGVVIAEYCAARALDMTAGQVSGVVTEKGLIKVDRVILAGGAWSALFLRNHGLSIPQLAVRATVAATGPMPQLAFTGGVGDDELALRLRADGGYTLAPAFFHELFIGPDSFRHLPRFIPTLAANPFGTRYWPAAPRGYPDAWTTARRWPADRPTPFEAMRVLNPAANPRRLRQMLRRFHRLFPQFGPVQLRQSWAGMIDLMPDIVPVIDHVAALPGLTLATGTSGHGFGIAPGIGRVLADMVMARDPGHDLGTFRLSRFARAAD